MTLEDLELRLGDPLDPANPLGQQEVLAADERGELLAAGERMLADYGLNAEFVPTELGGRLDRADRLAHGLRAVFRRDAALGIGYGVTSFISAVPVWTSGDAEQRRWMADLLLSGRRAAAGYTELAHGADFSRIETAAVARGGGLHLSGGKQLVNNVGRAEAVLLFARTDDAPGSRSHSHLLLDLRQAPPDRFRILPRFHTSGVRGCLLAGIEFQDCPVPAGAVVGELGGAMETVLRAFQVTRSVLPGMMIGVLDTQLRTVLRFARKRQLYGRSVADIPHARSVLVGAFLDLLICDSLATVAARALHLHPEQTSVLAAAVKYLVPKLMQDAAQQLATLLGARSFLRDGPYGIFQKHARDLPVVSLAHASSAVCLASIIAQLPRLAQRGWTAPVPPDPVLFRFADPLPPLVIDRLGLTTRGEDSLMGVLATEQELPGLTAGLRKALADLRERCVDLRPRERTVVAGRPSFELAERYAFLAAAAAAVGVWRAQDGFLGDTPWITGALHRLADRLGLDCGPMPDGVREAVLAELLDRHDRNLSFDLIRRRLA